MKNKQQGLAAVPFKLGCTPLFRVSDWDGSVERIELTVVDVVHEIATIMIFPAAVGLSWAQHRVLQTNKLSAWH